MPQNPGPRRRLAWLPSNSRWLLLLLILASAAMRLAHIHADPPDSLSFSRSIYNDGGAYALNARHRILQGSWISPGDNTCAQAPGFTLLAYASFKLFGLGLPSLRLLSILGTVAAMVLASGMALLEWGAPAAAAAAALLGLDYLFVMYGRLELIEGILTGVGTASLAAAYLSGRPPPPAPSAKAPGFAPAGWAAASAALLVAAMLIKPTGLVLVLPAAVSLLWRSRSEHSGRRDWAPILAFAGVLALLLLSYLFFFYLPNRWLFDDFRRAFHENASGLWDFRPLMVWFHTLTTPAIWGWRGAPLLALAAAGAAVAFRERTGLDRLAAAWFISGIIYLAPQAYRPSRFTVLFIPAAALLAARALSWMWNAPRPAAPVLAAAWWLISAAAATQAVIQFPPQKNLPELYLLTAVALIALGVAFGLRSLTVSPVAGSAIASALFIAAIAASLAPYASWLRSPRTSLEDSGVALHQLTAGAPTAGDNWCMALALMHSDAAYKVDWIPVPPAKLKQLGVRYLVYDATEPRIPNLYGALIRRGRRAARLRVGHYTINVVKL